jgi:hypothetical protein
VATIPLNSAAIIRAQRCGHQSTLR